MLVIITKIMAVSVIVYFSAQFIGLSNPDFARENRFLHLITVCAGVLMVLSLMLFTCRGG